MILKLIIAALFITLSPTGNWKSDPATAKISFTVKGPFGTVDGNFTGLKTDIQFDEKNLAASSITASVDVSTINTGIGLRNRDLRNKEQWFNADKYPAITFHSKKIEKADNGYKATGDLTIKGITNPAVIPFTFTSNSDSGVFKGTFTVNRQDYKVGSSTGSSVGNVITLTLEVPVKK